MVSQVAGNRAIGSILHRDVTWVWLSSGTRAVVDEAVHGPTASRVPRGLPVCQGPLARKAAELPLKRPRRPKLFSTMRAHHMIDPGCLRTLG
jgi:hypothetical protein